MRTTIRLPDEIAADVRQRCQRLGISVNALVCVALDAWLRGPDALPAVDDPPGPGRQAAPAPVAAEPQPLTPKQRYEQERARRKAARRSR